MKILVIQKKRIGDVLTSTVIFEALKEKYPDSELHYLVYENSLPVLENNPFIDKIIVLSEQTKKSVPKFLKFLFKIKREKYNTVVDAYGKPNSVLIGWFSAAKKRITFDKFYSRLLYTDVVERKIKSTSEATKSIEHRLYLLEPLGIKFGNFRPKLFVTELENDLAKNRLIVAGVDLNVPLLMISALGSNEGKTYPLRYMAAVLDTVASKGAMTLLLNYLPFQLKQATRLFELCKPDTQTKIKLDFYENDLRNFIAITNQCQALIGNEGGATNMSKSLGVPTFTIYSPNIKKIDWGWYENETSFQSVHLDDYIPNNERSRFEELYKIQDITTLFDFFKPSFFKEKLRTFLDINLK